MAIWYNFYFDLVPQFPFQKEKFYRKDFANPPKYQKGSEKEEGEVGREKEEWIKAMMYHDKGIFSP